MNGKSSDELLDQALGAEDPTLRREAFVALVDSDDWRLVLAPHVISCQGYRSGDTVQPDLATFEAVAEAIAACEIRVQRALELAGTRFSAALLGAIASIMGTRLVEPALDHLRTASGMRAAVLQRALQDADPAWVNHPQAESVIRRQLRQDQPRLELMTFLLGANCLGAYVDEFHKRPPAALEEWSLIGEAKVRDKKLYEIAMGMLPHAAAPLAYLLRLDPLPVAVAQRVIASARGDWIASAIEIAIMDGLDSPLLVALAEIGVRSGGRGLATATAWIGTAKLAKPLLMRLAVAMEQAGRNRVNEHLWMRRSAPSPDRALEAGRAGKKPDPMDAATLVRQAKGPKVIDLVGEILTTPWPEMYDGVLNHLCAINEEAALEVIRLCDEPDPEVSARARKARAWRDILWPSVDRTQEIECY